MGLSPITREAAPAGKKFPYVLFAAPPSGSEDYPGAVSSTLQLSNLSIAAVNVLSKTAYAHRQQLVRSCFADGRDSLSCS